MSEYSNEVMDDSPLGYYRLGEASGATATDSSGNAHHGTYNGTPGYGTTGLLTADADTAITFSGDEDVEISDHADFDFTRTSPFTIELWWLTSATGYAALVSKLAASGTYRGFELLQIADSDPGEKGLRFEFISDWNLGAGSAIVVDTDARYNDGARHHIVITYDGSGAASGVEFYVDGEVVATTTFRDTLTVGLDTTNSEPIKLGTRVHESLHYSGILDEVAIYGTALSPTRIAAHYAAAEAAVETWWLATL